MIEIALCLACKTHLLHVISHCIFTFIVLVIILRFSHISISSWRRSMIVVDTIELILFILGQWIRIYHRQHFGESLSNPSNSFSRISEWEFLPRQEINLLSVKVNNVFFTRCTWHPSKWLLCKHSIIFIVSSVTSRHKQIIKILELAFKKLKCFLSIIFIC